MASSKSADEKVLEIVRAWVTSAQDDRDALAVLEAGGGPLRPQAFHAQQGVEKLLKALLVSHGVDPDDSHNVGHLIGQVQKLDRQTVAALGPVDRLSQYAVVMRYPPRPGRATKSLDRSQVIADITMATTACSALDAALARRIMALEAAIAAAKAPPPDAER